MRPSAFISAALKNVTEIEGLDFRLDLELPHLPGEPVDEIRRIFVDAGREIVRSDRKRGHVRLQAEHGASFLSKSGTATGRELNHHAWTMPLHSFLKMSKALRIGCRILVFVAHMSMHERRAGFKRLLCA